MSPSSSEKAPVEDGRLGHTLKRAQHALRVRMDEALSPLRLTTPQYAVLSTVERIPGISNAGLAREAFVTPQTMQGILANLERDGLLSREPDPSHGRVLKSELTERGREVLAEAHGQAGAIEAAMRTALGVPQTEQLATLLQRCIDSLESD